MTEVLPHRVAAAGDGEDVADCLELLAAMSQDFATSLDLDATLYTALKRIMRHLDAEGASIFLVEGDSQELVCRVCVGGADITGIRLAAGQGIVGRAVRDNTSQMVRDARHDPNFAGAVDASTGFTTRSILCAPLSVKEERMGAIELINKRGADGLFDSRDLHLLEALAASAALALKNSRMAAALVEQERLRREIELAAEIQRGLLPAPRPRPFPVCGINLAARNVSGDFFDFFALADGRICFNVGDVSGKGIDAALLMAKVSSLFHCLGKTVHEPGRLLAQIDDEVRETATRGMFVTMVAGVYDPASGRIVLANAGHEPPLLHHDGGFSAYPAAAPPLGLPAGLRVSEGFPEIGITLGRGSLYIFTDGVTEGRLADGESLGVGGLQKLIGQFATLPLAERLAAIVERLDPPGARRHDDITLLAIAGGAE